MCNSSLLGHRIHMHGGCIYVSLTLHVGEVEWASNVSSVSVLRPCVVNSLSEFATSEADQDSMFANAEEIRIFSRRRFTLKVWHSRACIESWEFRF